jgi:3-deoxy-7-phosphoheptulonate synthase
VEEKLLIFYILTGDGDMLQTQDVRIEHSIKLPRPSVIHAELPLLEHHKQQIINQRKIIGDILVGRDKRLLVITGPCSVHNERGILEYAESLLQIRERYPHLYLVLRVMFEKPRTSLGWKGMLKDPSMTGKGDVPAGIRRCRKLMLKLIEMGIPIATETLDMILARYFNDLLSYATIGARSVTHPGMRELASIHSPPVGLKNPPSGAIKDAVNAVIVASQPHDDVIGLDVDGDAAQLCGLGNLSPHIILRGGEKGANYDAASVAETQALLRAAKLPEAIVIDAAHDNEFEDPRDPKSKKSAQRQIPVAMDVVAQRVAGSSIIRGVMIESYLKAGSQKLPADLSALDRSKVAYDQSVTDPCLSFSEIEGLLHDINALLS